MIQLMMKIGSLLSGTEFRLGLYRLGMSFLAFVFGLELFLMSPTITNRNVVDSLMKAQSKWNEAIYTLTDIHSSGRPYGTGP